MSFRTKSFFFSGLLPKSHLSKCPIVPSMTLSAIQIDKFCQSTSFPLSPEPPVRRPKRTVTPSTAAPFWNAHREVFLHPISVETRAHHDFTAETRRTPRKALSGSMPARLISSPKRPPFRVLSKGFGDLGALGVSAVKCFGGQRGLKPVSAADMSYRRVAEYSPRTRPVPPAGCVEVPPESTLNRDQPPVPAGARRTLPPSHSSPRPRHR